MSPSCFLSQYLIHPMLLLTPDWYRSSWRQSLSSECSTDCQLLCRTTSKSWAHYLSGPPDTLSSAHRASLAGLRACTAESSWKRRCRSRARTCIGSWACSDQSSCSLRFRTRSRRSAPGPSRSLEHTLDPLSCAHSWSSERHGRLFTTRESCLIYFAWQSRRTASCQWRNSCHLSASCWCWTSLCGPSRCCAQRRSTTVSSWACCDRSSRIDCTRSLWCAQLLASFQTQTASWRIWSSRRCCGCRAAWVDSPASQAWSEGSPAVEQSTFLRTS